MLHIIANCSELDDAALIASIRRGTTPDAADHTDALHDALTAAWPDTPIHIGATTVDTGPLLHHTDTTTAIYPIIPHRDAWLELEDRDVPLVPHTWFVISGNWRIHSPTIEWYLHTDVSTTVTENAAGSPATANQ